MGPFTGGAGPTHFIVTTVIQEQIVNINKLHIYNIVIVEVIVENKRYASN